MGKVAAHTAHVNLHRHVGPAHNFLGSYIRFRFLESVFLSSCFSSALVSVRDFEGTEDGGRHQGDRLGLPAVAGRRGLLARAAAATGCWTDR